MKLIKTLIQYFVFMIVFAVLGGVVIQTNTVLGNAISHIAGAIVGVLVELIYHKLMTHGHGFKLWYQTQVKYRKESIYLSFSYLYRLEVDGKYLLIRGNRLKNQYQPIGGVYKFYEAARQNLEELKCRTNTMMGNIDETTDLRLNIPAENVLKFMDWFLSEKGREVDPQREFREELIVTGLLKKEEFENLQYRKIYIHNHGITYSTYNSCYEMVYADIYAVTLNDEQKNLIRKAVCNHPDMLCLASEQELLTKCYGGVERNLGTNADWIIGN